MQWPLCGAWGYSRTSLASRGFVRWRTGSPPWAQENRKSSSLYHSQKVHPLLRGWERNPRYRHLQECVRIWWCWIVCSSGRTSGSGTWGGWCHQQALLSHAPGRTSRTSATNSTCCHSHQPEKQDMIGYIFLYEMKVNNNFLKHI